MLTSLKLLDLMTLVKNMTSSCTGLSSSAIYKDTTRMDAGKRKIPVEILIFVSFMFKLTFWICIYYIVLPTRFSRGDVLESLPFFVTIFQLVIAHSPQVDYKIGRLYRFLSLTSNVAISLRPYLKKCIDGETVGQRIGGGKKAVRNAVQFGQSAI